MNLAQLKLKNFRSYKDEVIIDINDLTAFVGENLSICKNLISDFLLCSVIR